MSQVLACIFHYYVPFFFEQEGATRATPRELVALKGKSAAARLAHTFGG